MSFCENPAYQKKGRKKPGETLDRRVRDAAMQLKSLPYAGYVPMIEVYPRLRGYHKNTIAAAVRATAKYMRSIGCGDWCEQHGQEGFWLGGSYKEIQRQEEIKKRKERRAAVREKRKMPTGKPFLATVRRARKYLKGLPEDVRSVTEEGFREGVFGCKKLRKYQWVYFVTAVLDSNTGSNWRRDGQGGLVRSDVAD